MKIYEITIIIRQDLSAQEVHKLSEQYSNFITGLGSEVVKKEYWGLRSLSYHIKKNKKGHYIFLIIQSSSSVVDKIKDDLKIKEEVLKHLILKVDEIEQKSSVMMQAPGDNEK